MAFKPRYINIRGRLLDLDTPRVMGIINITPDSFYEGSRVMDEDEIVRVASAMVRDGADIIDVGGYSTRPYGEFIAKEEERKRVLNAIRLISREVPEAVISIDTFRSEIAEEAVKECGAHIINDISGGVADPEMFSTVKRLNVPYVMMHTKGDSSTMQDNPVYDDVVADILRWFGPRISELQSEGVKDIIIDPGIGFGKTIRHNFEILRRLGDFRIAGLPLLIGVSRKSMIWKTLGVTPGEALNGTTVLNSIALLGGADILRVHDVKEAVQAVKLIGKMRKSANPAPGTLNPGS
ncbi:MAG: dihydropteroate synthase [Bacteroidales bacterium]